MKWIVVCICCLLFGYLEAQITYKIERDINYADIRVRVGEDVSHPNLRVMIGPEIQNPDLTVGVTSVREQASFIIVNQDYADLIVRAGEDVNFENFRVLTGVDVDYPDVRIQTKSSGHIDYAIYTEKDSVSMPEMISVLLPVINRHIKRENAALKRWFGD